jgi:hypothetical protein
MLNVVMITSGAESVPFYVRSTGTILKNMSSSRMEEQDIFSESS